MTNVNQHNLEDNMDDVFTNLLPSLGSIIT